jgi:hypothetical protein
MPGSDGTIISSMTIFGDCAAAGSANATVMAAASNQTDFMTSSRVCLWGQLVCPSS